MERKKLTKKTERDNRERKLGKRRREHTKLNEKRTERKER